MGKRFRAAHVVGAGMAGLNAATILAEAGLPVTISEAGPRAGGRCRSYRDPQLGMTIDNGNHLVLAGNPAVAAFRARVGANTPLAGGPHADFPFADLATGERWSLRINDGPLPWWVLFQNRRVPGTKARDYLALGRLLGGKKGETIGDRIRPEGPLWRRMLRAEYRARRGCGALGGQCAERNAGQGRARFGAACGQPDAGGGVC